MNERMTPSEIQALVLYRDGLILILNKPPGLPVHGGPGGGDNLERHFQHLRYGLPNAPALGHRLDRDTSGCLVLGRHRKALARLGRLFQEGKIEKTYWAVVRGAPPQPEGVIEQPLGKISTRAGGWRIVVDPAGQRAITRYRLLGSGEGLSWLELRPETGRTHQIRVHCASLGCPILGDRQYGKEPAGFPSLALHLHAQAILVPLYANKAPIFASAEPPEHMRASLSVCGWRAG
jgi:tRNA pseudouridine32 synthase/23S rRNA pseudouridine746 synthase/23S rRNA pseudouridine1911/1915/1917 synthase